MAVSALPRSREGAPLKEATLPAAILVMTLVTPAFDLLALVQPGFVGPNLGLGAAGLAAMALLGMWARFPLTSWLVAATLAAFASLGLRFVGADIAPALSLLAVVGLGVGGAFASEAVSGPEGVARLGA